MGEGMAQLGEFTLGQLTEGDEDREGDRDGDRDDGDENFTERENLDKIIDDPGMGNEDKGGRKRYQTS